MVNLIGEKCLIKCSLDQEVSEVLLDTGAQVLLISINYLKEHHPTVDLKDIKELLDNADDLNIRWGNNTIISYMGWVELDLQFDETQSPSLKVPFLVVNESLDQPLFGFNAIKALVQTNTLTDPKTSFQLLQSSFAFFFFFFFSL